jgi:hypothetical protein
MRRTVSLLIFVAFLAWERIPAEILNVPDQYANIQAAIDASSPGDTVLAAPGRYFENIDFRGKNITVSSRFILDGDTTHIRNTIIDGSQPAQPDSASCVRIVSGEDSTAVLQGFTLTGGRGTRWRDIHNSLYYREGGGIMIELSSPRILNNIIAYNDASDRTNCRSAGGGGIRAGDGNPLIANNVIMYNTGRYGGGIVFNYATGVIRNNVIWHNSGGDDYGGGGIWSFAVGPSVVENNTISENHSRRGGGGILVWSTAMTCRNNIVWSNTAVNPSPQIESNQGALTATYNDIQGGWEGEGNIDLSPLYDTNLRLTEASPCIDSGNPEIMFNDPEDATRPDSAAWPSMGILRNDMGAFGGPGRLLLPSIDGYVGVLEPESDPRPISALQITGFPNPFNSEIEFGILLADESPVTIDVFDLTGRRVAAVERDSRPGGRLFYHWDAGRLASGVYLARVIAGGQTGFLKMTLLK